MQVPCLVLEIAIWYTDFPATLWILEQLEVSPSEPSRVKADNKKSTEAWSKVMQAEERWGFHPSIDFRFSSFYIANIKKTTNHDDIGLLSSPKKVGSEVFFLDFCMLVDRFRLNHGNLLGLGAPRFPQGIHRTTVVNNPLIRPAFISWRKRGIGGVGYL